MGNEVTKAFKGIDSAIRQGTARALNRALSSTKTQLAKELKDETGLATADVKKRLAFFGATVNNLSVTLSVLIARGIPVSLFGATVKKIQVLQKNGRKVLHYGVTARIGGARDLVQGAFFLLGKTTGTTVIGRKDAFTDGVYTDPGADKYPTQVMTTDILGKVAEEHQDEARQYLADTFDRIVGHEIDFSIQKKFDNDT